MMIIITIRMISFLNGTTTINNAKPKNRNKRRFVTCRWHPSRWWDWCMPEDDKNRLKSCGKMSKGFMQLDEYQI